MPNHHVTDELLIDYAAGNLEERASILVASHLALCPRCRNQLEKLEAIGGALMDSAEPESVDDGLLQRVLSRIDSLEEEPLQAGRQSAAAGKPTDVVLPRPLRDYVDDLDGLSWRRLMRGVHESPLAGADAGAKGALLRIEGGRAVPRHTHGGNEMTLVLQGSYSDELGRFARGDVAITDPAVTHQPVADAGETCLCYVVTDAPLKLTGPLGWIVNRFNAF